MQKAGSSIDDFDLLIAATAFTMNSTLVTNKQKHFKRIKGLKIENWSK
jgi:tRNA(fMet)-specific endonuclease VapC